MKFAHLAVTKSGSNILRNELRWQGKQRLKIKGSLEDQADCLEKMIKSDCDVMGHLGYSDRAAELLKDHFVIFQFRDPRDIIVANYIWCTKLYGERDWKATIEKMAEHMLAMEPWHEHCNLAIRYEHLTEKEYPPTHTFQKRGSHWREDFPKELMGYYEELCYPTLKYWEIGV